MWRSAFLKLSRSRLSRELSTRSGLGRRIASRFVAGERLEDAVAVARELNRAGAGAELDYLGENVRDRCQADDAADAYLKLLDRLSDNKVDAHVSLKLTQLGLDLDPELCASHVRAVAERAEKLGSFLWLDMESSEYVDRTLGMYRELRSRRENVGVAIQSYLYRSRADVEGLIAVGGTVRLCKGAYMESSKVAYPNKEDVDRNFAVLSEQLLSTRRYQAIATHDKRMMKHVLRYARANAVEDRQIEFQMLYGVRRDLQERLLREGHRVRVYVPYGREWYPYLMRRLAERPANLLFVLSNVVREAMVRRRQR